MTTVAPARRLLMHLVTRAGTDNIQLSGSDPDGDSLYFELVGNPSNAVILSQNGTNATARFTATQCIGNEQFRFRVCDRESGSSERLCSTRCLCRGDH